MIPAWADARKLARHNSRSRGTPDEDDLSNESPKSAGRELTRAQSYKTQHRPPLVATGTGSQSYVVSPDQHRPQQLRSASLTSSPRHVPLDSTQEQYSASEHGSPSLSSLPSDSAKSPLLQVKGNGTESSLSRQILHSSISASAVNNHAVYGATSSRSSSPKQTSASLQAVAPLVSFSTSHLLSHADSQGSLLSDESLFEVDKPPTLLNDFDVIREQCLANPTLSSLLICIPLGLLSHLFDFSVPFVFGTNFFAIIPLAWMLGYVTEELALHTSPITGGLLNAFFGNIVETIVAVAALRKGLIELVQTSLLGSILSNMLLVLGMSFVFGGLRFPQQTFNRRGASVFSSMLLLACLALAIPSAYVSSFSLEANQSDILDISRITAVIILFIYMLYLQFQLSPTNSSVFDDDDDGEADDSDQEEETPQMSWNGALMLLTVITCCIALCSDILVSQIEPITLSYNINERFVGLILLPIVGNAAEHATAVSVAMRNKLNLSIGVAVGSSTQIALFVIPLLTILGWILDEPLTLNFGAFETISLVLASLVATFIIKDGQSNYLLGVLLIGSYCILATAFAFSPRPSVLSESDDGMSFLGGGSLAGDEQ